MNMIKRKTVRGGTKTNIHQLVRDNPDQIVAVRTSSVYSQIARMGRLPQRKDKQLILVNELENACKSLNVKGATVMVEPTYVSMKAKDVLFCFGSQVDKLQINSQIHYR